MDDPISALGEIAQQVELATREVDHFVAPRRPLLFEVDDDVPERKARDRRMGPAQYRVHPGEQFLDIKGLCNVVVGAKVQTAQFVASLLAACGKEDDRRSKTAAKRAKELETTDIWQRDIQKYQVRQQVGRELQGCSAILRIGDLETLELEVIAHHAREGRVVLDEQDSRLDLFRHRWSHFERNGLTRERSNGLGSRHPSVQRQDIVDSVHRSSTRGESGRGEAKYRDGRCLRCRKVSRQASRRARSRAGVMTPDEARPTLVAESWSWAVRR